MSVFSALYTVYNGTWHYTQLSVQKNHESVFVAGVAGVPLGVMHRGVPRLPPYVLDWNLTWRRCGVRNLLRIVFIDIWFTQLVSMHTSALLCGIFHYCSHVAAGSRPE